MADAEYKEEKGIEKEYPVKKEVAQKLAEDIDKVRAEKVPPREVRTTASKASSLSGGIQVSILGKNRAAGFVVVDVDFNGWHMTPEQYAAAGFVRNQAKVDVSKLTPCYDWDKEIEATLPNRDDMKKALLRSIWLAGGFEKGKGNESRYLAVAFPKNLIITEDSKKGK